MDHNNEDPVGTSTITRGRNTTMNQPKWQRRFRAQGITLEQFVFQFFIVALGVWLAIVVGERTNRAERRSQARAALSLVLHQLREDGREIASVLALQESNIRAVRHFIGEAANRPPNDSILHAALFVEWQSNTTFFARRAAYTMLVTSGLLQHVDNEQLRLQLAELYDRDYVRLTDDAKLLDSVTQTFRTSVNDWWNPALQRPNNIPDALPMAVGRADRFVNNAVFYTRLLKDEIKELEVLEATIQKYLDS